MSCCFACVLQTNNVKKRVVHCVFDLFFSEMYGCVLVLGVCLQKIST